MPVSDGPDPPSNPPRAPAVSLPPAASGVWLGRALGGWPYLVPAVLLSALYGCTLQRSTGNAFSVDTSKFDYLGEVLGTAHPPGYPLYTMADALIVRLVPVGTVAFRANLLSAVCAVLLAVVVVDLLLRIDVRPVLAAAGATAIGLMPQMWKFAVVAEIYTMTVLSVAVVLACLVRYETTGRRGWLRAGVLLLALSFAHATSNVLLVPGLLLYLAVRRVGWLFRPRELVRLLPASAGLALLPYGYLFWRTAAGAAFLDVRVTNLDSLVAVITGQRYGPKMFAVTSADLPGRVSSLLQDGMAQFGPLAVLVVLGLAALLVRRRLLAGVLVLWAVCNAVFLLDYRVSDWETMLLPLWLVLAIWAVLGLDGAVTVLLRLLRRPVGSVAEHGLAVVLGVSLMVTAAVSGYAAADRSGVDAQAPVNQAIKAARQDALIFTSDYGTRHQFLYRLLPGQWGRQHNVWVAKGAVYGHGRDRDVQQIRAYCSATSAPWVWSEQEQAVGPGVPLRLRTYVFGRSYAAHVRHDGLQTPHVAGQLYQVRCPS